MIKRVLIALLLVAGCVQAQSLRHVIRRAGVIANASQIPRDGLVAEYLFTVDARDTSGNGNNLSQNGSPSYTNGVATLDTSSYLTSISADFGLTNALTISAWINRTDITQRSYIAGKMGYAGNRGYTFFAESSIYSNILKFVSYDEGGTDAFSLVSTNALTTSQWYHVAIAVTSGSQVLYLNGEQKASSTYNAPWDLSSYQFAVGAGFRTYAPLVTGGIVIDNLRVYDRSLDNSEIQQLYNEGHD